MKKYGYAALGLLLVFSSCTKDDSSEEAFPGFSVRIETVMVESYDEKYASTHTAYLIMENMPEGEYIVGLGGCYSDRDPVPDTTDYHHMADHRDNQLFLEWDWDEPLIWSASSPLTLLLPGRTHYFRGVVQTNRDIYYSNVVELLPDKTAPVAAPYDPAAYQIPVIFHYFPRKDGSYPSTDYAADQLEYANMVYSNYYGLPHGTDTGIRFVPATKAPDGTTLRTPGVVLHPERLSVTDFQPNEAFDPEKHLWDREQVLNVWLCPLYIPPFSEANPLNLGFTSLPLFDSGELLEGCNEYEPEVVTGIFLNSLQINTTGALNVFAHEAGHYLGLKHIFEEDWCDDTPRYDRSTYDPDEMGFVREFVDNPGELFLSDNVMDYADAYLCLLTPDQNERIRYTLEHAYFIPGPPVKTTE